MKDLSILIAVVFGFSLPFFFFLSTVGGLKYWMGFLAGIIIGVIAFLIIYYLYF